MCGSRPAEVISVLLGLAGCFYPALCVSFSALWQLVPYSCLAVRQVCPIGRAELCLIHSFAIGLQSPLIEPGSRSGVQLPPRREALLSEWQRLATICSPNNINLHLCLFFNR